MINHKAIYELYPNVVSVDDTAGAFDKDGNKVTIDESAVNSWADPNQYKYDRHQAYASIEEQLDMQYWDKVNNTNLWQEHINAVKAKYPKGSE